MKVRCPECGTAMSLNVLIAHDDAREALIALAGISDGLARALLKYLTLFRPSEKDLSFARVAKLLNELLPMIRAETVERKRQTYPAPREAWIWAAGKCIEARDAGRLKTPLTGHGFLLEVITQWTAEKTAVANGISLAAHRREPQSKLRDGANGLMEWANGDGTQVAEAGNRTGADDALRA